MQELSGQCNGPLVLVHGGAGAQDPSGEGLRSATDEVVAIAKVGLKALSEGGDPVDIVTSCLQLLEAAEGFNAGYGSALQEDGQARLSAALMEGERQRFSGVMLATNLIHPSVLARHLQTCRSRVLTYPGTEILARQLGLRPTSPIAPARLERWYERAKRKAASNTLDECDTVGVVVRAPNGRLAAGTSTGGRGFEFPGRVSDSATVAGNYASRFAAISCTGTGEEIVDDAVAARLETRRRDGMALREASRLCLDEAKQRQRSYGWIAADCDGFWAAAHATPSMVFAVIGEVGIMATSVGYSRT